MRVPMVRQSCHGGRWETICYALDSNARRVPVLPHQGRDRTTVINANRKIRSLMAERRSIYTQVTELTSRIKQQARTG